MVIFTIIILAIFTTLAGGLFAIRYKDKLHLILGFSAGTILGVTLFDLIPESIELVRVSYTLEKVFVFCALGFVTYLILDRFFSLHGGEHCDNCESPRQKKSNLGAGALVLHSFLDGLGIGLAFKVSPTIGWVFAAAVLIHKFTDGVNTVGIILRKKDERKTAIKWLTADALAPALGVLASYFIIVSESTLGLLLAFFAGLFLYIGASDLIPESHHDHPTVLTTVMTILGIVVIYFATYIAF